MSVVTAHLIVFILFIHKLLVVRHPIIIILHHIINLHQDVAHRLLICDVQSMVVHHTEAVNHSNQSLIQFKKLFGKELALCFLIATTTLL